MAKRTDSKRKFTNIIYCHEDTSIATNLFKSFIIQIVYFIIQVVFDHHYIIIAHHYKSLNTVKKYYRITFIVYIILLYIDFFTMYLITSDIDNYRKGHFYL